MNTLRQAAELALEAMKDFDYDKRLAAIETVELALAESRSSELQEPVAWYDEHGMITHDPFEGVTPLYTSPLQGQWLGLSDDEILLMGKEMGMKCRLGGNPNIDFDYARAIEAKLKEKNT